MNRRTFFQSNSNWCSIKTTTAANQAMPTKRYLGSDIEVSQERRDSTFYDDSAPCERLHQEDIDGIRTATLHFKSERIRTESTDSGIGGMAAPAMVVKKCESDLVHISQTEKSQLSTISEQTLMLLQKMQTLDMKLQSMETQLKNEQLQRLALEAKVLKLEKDNKQLKSVRAQAGKQLQSFAEMFYTETELIKLKGSWNPSPHASHSSLSALKRRSRADSLFSSCSANSGSRLSHGSM